MKPPLEHTLSLPQAPAIVNERHRRIMALLHQQTSLSVSQLAHMLGVSEVTIRKDLTQLEQQQMLYRVHGSAILANPYIQERHVNDKEKLCSDQKRAIGAYAARLVEPRDTILIASGTTTLAMAREIREVEELTAITTSLSVATTLAENDECTVIQLGGALRNSSFSVVGPFAEQMLRQFSCSKLFFGVDGFDLNYGVTTTNLMGGHLALMMIETVQKVIALVDSSKFGRRGFCKMCDVDRIDMVITDDGVSPIVVEQLQEAGIDVRIVEVIRTTVPCPAPHCIRHTDRPSGIFVRTGSGTAFRYGYALVLLRERRRTRSEGSVERE